MKRIDVTWDYMLILEWCDEKNVWCDGPDLETVLPHSLLTKILTWSDAMNESWGWLSDDEYVDMPESKIRELHEQLLDIRSEIRSLGFEVAPLDEWWLVGASRESFRQ